MSFTLILTMAMTAIVIVVLYLFRNALHKAELLGKENVQLSMEVEKIKAESQAALSAVNANLSDARKNLDNLSDRLTRTAGQLASAREENSSLNTRLELLGQEIERREEQFQKQERERKEQEDILETRFRNLANDILRQNTADLKTQNEERLREILTPLRTNIDEFRKTVTDTYNNESQ